MTSFWTCFDETSICTLFSSWYIYTPIFSRHLHTKKFKVVKNLSADFKCVYFANIRTFFANNGRFRAFPKSWMQIYLITEKCHFDDFRSDFRVVPRIWKSRAKYTFLENMMLKMWDLLEMFVSRQNSLIQKIKTPDYENIMSTYLPNFINNRRKMEIFTKSNCNMSYMWNNQINVQNHAFFVLFCKIHRAESQNTRDSCLCRIISCSPGVIHIVHTKTASLGNE